MFTSIKDKLLSVKKNVTLFGTEESATQPKRVPINLNAGAAILQHFQNEWLEIRGLNEENARQADKVAQEIEVVSKNVVTSKENIGLITHILTSSSLTTNITHCLSQVKELYNTCEAVERKLIELEDLIDEVEFDNMKRQHSLHLENYRARKKETLLNLKCTLDEQYKKQIKKCEANKKIVSEERQRVFQEAFKSDLEIYKSLGTIPKVDLPKKQNGAILEEIQLDFDQSELDKFFEDDNNTGGTL